MKILFPISLFSTILGSSLLVQAQEIEVTTAAVNAAIECNKDYGPLSFVLLEDEAVNAAVEDDIRADLAKLGFTVEARRLSKEDINVARQSGDFHFSITETWGTPYDPHSYASGWIDGKGGEGIFPSMVNFDEPSSREELLELVKDVLKEDSVSELEAKWLAIHRYYHAQAVMLPMWGKRIPTLMNSRLTGYEAGYQQFDYPVHRLVPLTGSTTVTIAPGARTGLFRTVGYLDAHTYGPNEFFSSNWIYEGLVAYGQGGQILPSLATAWNIVENDIGGDTYTFTLRENVQFHDGTPWNCEAARINFDHLLAGELRSRHGWYGIPLYTEDWYCNSDTEFVLRTNSKHGPYLQELTLIRPIRMISPAAFVNTTDPISANSCRLDWGVIDGNDVSEDVVCAGITGIYGTGPFVFDTRDTVTLPDGDEVDNQVVFLANENYWGGAPAIKRLEVVRHETSDEAKTALLNGELDVVWGSGVLPDADIKEIESSDNDSIRVFHSGDLQNVILLLNSGKPPFDDINVRKTVIHAINKGAIIERELKGLQEVVDNVFPREAPYCDVDLTPRWSYDFEKAVLLSCGGSVATGGLSARMSWSLGLGLSAACVLLIGVAMTYYNKSKNMEAELELARKEGATEA